MALSKILPASQEQYAGARNLIINGAMQVAQRGTSFTSVTATAYHLDRFQTILSGLGTWTVSQSTTAPTGFSNSLKYECTTADASPATTDYFAIYHKFEGQDLQHLKKGAASAESVTLSFWVRSNKTGTYQVNLYDNDNTRVIGSTYSISTADTWEHKTITYSGDTTGALDNDNALSLFVEWWLGSGTDYSSGAVPTSWETAVDTDRNAGGTVNLADSTSNTFYITGVQLEVGEATPFEHRSFGDELARCQRYFERIGGYNYPAIGNGMQRDTTQSHTHIYFKVTKRANPTESRSNIITTDRFAFDEGITGVGQFYSTTYGAQIQYTHNSVGAQRRPILISTPSGQTGYVDFDAEL